MTMKGTRPDKSLSAVQEDYARIAICYEERWKNFLSISRDWVLENFPQNMPENTRILDLGCGTGAFLKQLYDLNPLFDLTGVDGSSAMLALARDREVPAQWLQEDIGMFGPPVDCYDVALSMNVLHHLDNPARHLEQLKQLAGDKGVVFLCDFAIDTPFIKGAELYWRLLKPSHYKAFSSTELQAMIAKAGFKIKAHEVLKPDGFWRIQIYALAV